MTKYAFDMLTISARLTVVTQSPLKHANKNIFDILFCYSNQIFMAFAGVRRV